MMEGLDSLITEIHNARDPEQSAFKLVTGIAERLHGVTHPSEALALGDALVVMRDDIVAAVGNVPGEPAVF